MIYSHELKERSEKKRSGPRPAMPALYKNGKIGMFSYLSERKLSFELAEANKWYPTKDDYGDVRIVIPCSNSLGVPYWQARAVFDNTELRYSSPFATREDSICIVWPADLSKRTAVVVEGPMDALAAAGAGAIGFALMGNTPNPEVFAFLETHLKAVRPKKLLVIPDLDTPQMAGVVLSRLAGSGLRAWAKMPSAKDLAAMLPEEREKLIG
jgi:hypothetical protein